MTSIYSWIGHRCREGLVHIARLGEPAHMGHRVVIFPGEAGTGSASDLRASALAPELRRLGWRATVVPSQLELSQRLRIVRLERPDVILLQQSRHPLNRPRYYPSVPCVYDADDADILDPDCRDAVIECCADSVAVIAGSRFLADHFRQYNSRVSIIWTTTYLGLTGHIPPNQSRAPIVAWATSNAIGYAHESELVREVIIRLSRKVAFSYYQYGVLAEQREEADRFLEPIRRSGVPVRVFGPLPYAELVSSLQSVAVGLQPICWENLFSRGKSFGKVLAYLAADVVVVASNAADHPLFFKDYVNGILVSDEVDHWVDGIASLLHAPTVRGHLVAKARSDFIARLTTPVAARRVGDVLSDAVRVQSKPI
jgi:hypothetical protein